MTETTPILYADVDLGGGTAAYKRKFMKMVPNCHAYYMPDMGGMAGCSYRETSADHWIRVRIIDSKILKRICDVLGARYKFTPTFHWRPATDTIFQSKKTFADLDYQTRDYNKPEIHPGEEGMED